MAMPATPSWGRPSTPQRAPGTPTPPGRPSQLRLTTPSQCCAARSGEAGASTSGSALAEGGGTVVGFQCNERYLQWDDSAYRQLIRIHAAAKLGTDVDHVSTRLAELAVLLPGLMARFEVLKADLVVRLVADTEAVARRMVELRTALPGVDVSAAVASDPWLLSRPDAAALERQMGALRAALRDVRVEEMIRAEPRLLLVDIGAVLEELARQLPPGVDPARVLAMEPSSALGMRAAGLPSSLEVDDGVPAD